MKYSSRVSGPPTLKKMPVQNKYKNQKTTIDGIKFDSKAEAAYYYLLKQRKVSNFKMQESFVIHDSFSLNGKRYV